MNRAVSEVIIFGTNKDVRSTKSLNYLIGLASLPDHLYPKFVF